MEMKIGNKTGVEKSLSRETISAPEVLDNPGGPEPTLLAQNALALVSMGQHTGGPETAFDEVENRSYALRNVSSEAPPGWLPSHSPRSAGSLHSAPQGDLPRFPQGKHSQPFQGVFTDEWAHLGDLVAVPKPLCHFKIQSKSFRGVGRTSLPPWLRQGGHGCPAIHKIICFESALPNSTRGKDWIAFRPRFFT